MSNKVISFTMIKNEEDIVESFVLNNLNYVDKMFFLVNDSTDNTLEILNKLGGVFL